jgi:hypothetical protein
MSWKKINRPQDPSAANPNNDGTQKESKDRHVYVENGVQIDLVQDLRDDIKTAQTNNATDNRKQLFWARIAAFAAIGAAFFVGWQGYLLQQSNGINRESMVAVQRAFVTWNGFDPDRVINRLNPTDPSKSIFRWTFFIKYENSGATPARGAVCYSEISVLPDEPSEERFTADRGVLPRTTIGPKAIQKVGPLFVEEPVLFGADLGNVTELTPLNVQPNVFMWGWMVYNDTFPSTNPHVTEFCKHLVGVRITSETQHIVLMTNNCSKHNCTDEECEDYAAITALSRKAK